MINKRLSLIFRTLSSSCFLLLVIGWTDNYAIAFSPVSRSGISKRKFAAFSSSETTEAQKTSVNTDFGQIDKATTTEAKLIITRVPLTWSDMIRQASTCMKQASAVGVTRQVVRILLPRDSTSGDFGKYYERSTIDRSGGGVLSSIDESIIQLVPPDESWQGGIMQLYRAAAPTAMEIIRTINFESTVNNLVPRITEDRNVDESGVDGVGLLTTSDNSISCWIQPTQESVNDFVATASQAKKEQLVVLLNPQWRQVNDALDTASQQSTNGFLKGLANLLGGKGAVLQACAKAGFVPVYTLEQYVCKGTNVRLLQMYDSVTNAVGFWNVYCQRDDLENYIQVGTTTTSQRPTYQEVEDMMNQADIGYKYARDIGLQPKL